MTPEIQPDLPFYAQAILVTLGVAGWLILHLGCFAILLLSAGDLHMQRYLPRYVIVPACLVLAVAWPLWMLVGMLALVVILASNAFFSLRDTTPQPPNAGN